MSVTNVFGARPKKRRGPPRGYRLLEIGEAVQVGDMVYFRSRWEPIGEAEVGRRIAPYSFLRARKIERGGVS